MKKALCCVVWVLVALGAARSQDRIEAFGGYSYQRLQSTGSVTNVNVNGWNGALTLKHHWIGATADFSGLYGTPTVATIPVHVHQHNFLFGPQVSVHLWKVQPFAHALFGVTRLRQEAGTTSATSTDFATALGGGVDVGVWPHLAVRVGQVDYFRTNYTNNTQNSVRVSAGLVARF